MKMDKLKMQTPDLTDKNIERIASLFPNVITEIKDETGNIKKAVDFDLLKTALSKNLVEADDERYRLDWPGKKVSLLKANTPIAKTLRPCRAESVNFDTTQNLYIEGDNFEVLKILQESYLGKIKIIYIDPPYNTGNDFIYKDDFAKSKEDYEEEIGVEDEEGGKLFRNTDSNGRFHSDWLSMMYERLGVARDLLKDDGVIFVSIDDNEVHNLRKSCDEIFGEGNFVSQVPRIAKRTSDKGTHFRPTKDYVLVYAKNISLLQEFGIKKDRDEDEYKFVEENGRKYKKSGASLYQPSLDPLRGCANQRYYIEAPDGSLIIPPGNVFPENAKDAAKIKPASSDDNVWRWSVDTYLKQKHLLIFTEGSSKNPLVDENGKQSKWNIYPKVYFDEDVEATLHPEDAIYDYPNSQGTKELNALSIPFSFSKPTGLLSFLLRLINGEDSLVLDFFSGSATTAHAVMQLNAEDGGNRKFIMVQLPEKTDESSEAYKAGYKTIADIGKERIRRAGNKIVEELKTKNKQLELGKDPVDPSKLDIGFRVYKTDDTNMKDVFYHPAELNQKQLAFLESNIKDDRTPEDLLTQVILDLGLELSLPIETKKIGKNTVFIVQTNALVACFDNDIGFKIVDIIADLKPFKVVFKDASFKDDKDRINVEERFKRLSPETKVTVI
jgi:adenine-specific DNA-methyltransferase